MKENHGTIIQRQQKISPAKTAGLFLIISIPEDGEFFAEGLQELHIEFCRGDAFCIVCDRSEGLALGIYNNSASVIMTVGVVPYPVDAYHETLVLEGPRLQENVPYTATALRPVSNVYHSIVERAEG